MLSVMFLSEQNLFWLSGLDYKFAYYIIYNILNFNETYYAFI